MALRVSGSSSMIKTCAIGAATTLKGGDGPSIRNINILAARVGGCWRELRLRATRRFAPARDGTHGGRRSECVRAPAGAWLDHGLCAGEAGWVDSYRALHPEGQDYTWWSNRGAARAKNVGWRIDYQLATPSLRDKLVACAIAPSPRFSDHAPYVVDYAA